MGRKEALKCPFCVYSGEFHQWDVPLAMNRLYVKVKRSWKAVGWICPNCGHVVIDVDLPLKKYSTVRKREKYEISPGLQVVD